MITAGDFTAKKMNRDEAARLYATHIQENQPNLSSTINQAIIGKWSRSGLITIKNRAWKILESKRLEVDQ